MNWSIKDEGYDPTQVADQGNRFLTGNGYMGVRGTLEEQRKNDLVAVNLAGIYDQVGDGWREPLNAPNPFYTTWAIDGERLHVNNDKRTAHYQALDYRYGLRKRSTRWRTDSGAGITVISERFISLSDAHQLMMSMTFEVDQDCSLQLTSWIDGDVWDIYGPHYEKYDCELNDEYLAMTVHVQKSDKKVAVVRRDLIVGTEEQKLQFENWQPVEDSLFGDGGKKNNILAIGKQRTLRLKAGESITIQSFSAIYTTNDCMEITKAAIDHNTSWTFDDYLRIEKNHRKKWDQVWETSEIFIEGDQASMEAINYSLYHLNIAAPRHGGGLSIPARALSGQTYKGAIFWDTEVFMLDYFLYSQPEIARSLVQYRIDTLEGAIIKAKNYGYEGAFYAWESQEGGYDACSDYNVTDVFTKRAVRTYFKDKQMHISSAIVWGIYKYYKATGDESLLLEGGAQTIFECARFYQSLLVQKVGNDVYEIHDVIGPDEYHERVNNNGYTNRMAKFTMDVAEEIYDYFLGTEEKNLLKLLKQTPDLHELMRIIRDGGKKLKRQSPNSDKLIEQFDGYFKLEDTRPDVLRSRLVDQREYWGGSTGVASDTQVIKQADVVTMMAMFPEEYDTATMKANWDFYEPRTEHGSSLSACMYALLACRFGDSELAFPFFLKSATAEIRGGGKQWAGLVYIGGTHPASAGGAWKNIVEGFAGLKIEGDNLIIHPVLPCHWKSLKFPIVHKGRLYQVNITHENYHVSEVKEFMYD